MRYIVQAKNNTCRKPHDWDDSKYGGETFAEAQQAELDLLALDSAWMPGKRETRIRDTAA